MSKVILTSKETLSSVLMFKDMKKYKVLNKEEEQELFKTFYSDEITEERKNKIRETIICSNLRWAFSLSKKYVLNGMSQNDMANIAYEALVLSFNKFDYTKNVRFSSFASFYIQNALNDFIYGEGKIINDSSTYKVVDKNINKVINKLEQLNGYTPSYSEIVDEYKNMFGTKINEDVLIDRFNIRNGIASIDNSINSDDDNHSTIESTTDFNSKHADNDIINNDRNQIINTALSTVLTEREKNIIMYSFGLVDGIEHTNEMISDRMNLTRERVGQLLKESIVKLQSNKKLLTLLA